jgi:hypothetical protein
MCFRTGCRKALPGFQPDSEKAELLASVPGTVEAREAVLDAQVPETAVVNRSEAALTVVYDGEPKFERIKGLQSTMP